MTKYGELVKVMLGENAPADSVIEFYVQSTVDRVRAYCNREDIPDGLTNTVVEITLDRLTEMYGSKDAQFGQGRSVVQHAQDGRQSVNYSSPGQMKTTTASEGDFLQGYLMILNRYRTMAGVAPRRTQGDYFGV